MRPAYPLQPRRTDDLAVNQVLGEDHAPNQGLRRIAREIACDQIAFETSKVRQELLIDAGLAIDGRHLGPELARLDRQSVPANSSSS
ncbi:hypothetical protein WJ970_08770 [Achromobacter xylosoxidans]